MIPYGRQIISDDDIECIVDVLKSDYLTQGPKVPTFERAVANYCNAQHAVAFNSATSALHIACLALNVGDGDIVWTSPISFVASANCALYCDAHIDFVDIDLTTGNMCVEALATKLVRAKELNKLPKVVIAVHLAGQSCDMQAIHRLSLQYNFQIIEDASHAIGAKYLGHPVGNCAYSDITVFSFHPVKIITTAEGGMAVTNNRELQQRLSLLRSHGITADPAQMEGENHGPWYYEQVALGFNYRMSELHAALGISQLQLLDKFVEKRNQLAQIYAKQFDALDISYLAVSSDCYSSYHLFVLQLDTDCAETHKRVITDLREQKVFAHVHYIPIHLQPYYQKLGFKQGDFPNAELYYQQAVTIPLYPDLKPEQQAEIVEKIKNIL